jgi:hypothetical protein
MGQAAGFGSPPSGAHMATKKQDTPSVVEAFVLRDCGFGKAGEVVELSPSDAKAGEEHGMVDLNAAAVANAKSLKGN